MLTYILIFLAICSIIGPALLLLPSRRQREQMALRTSARRRGMHVELARIDDPEPDPAKYRTLSGKMLPAVISCVALSRQRRREREWRERPPPAWRVVRVPGGEGAGLPAGWRWAEGDPGQLSRELQVLLEGALDALPADVLALGEEQLRLSVYWQERSGEEGLEAIDRLMSELFSVPLTDPEEEDETG